MEVLLRILVSIQRWSCNTRWLERPFHYTLFKQYIRSYALWCLKGTFTTSIGHIKLLRKSIITDNVKGKWSSRALYDFPISSDSSAWLPFAVLCKFSQKNILFTYIDLDCSHATRLSMGEYFYVTTRTVLKSNVGHKASDNQLNVLPPRFRNNGVSENDQSACPLTLCESSFSMDTANMISILFFPPCALGMHKRRLPINVCLEKPVQWQVKVCYREAEICYSVRL